MTSFACRSDIVTRQISSRAYGALPVLSDTARKAREAGGAWASREPARTTGAAG